jgi:serine/threonine protein kinase
MVCLQGHLWVDDDRGPGGDAGSPFCPKCGLRLHPADGLNRFVGSPAPLRGPPPTPLFNTDFFQLSRASTATQAGPAIQPSEIEEIPGYELLGVLGRGGMGIVFRARQLSLKRQVALKMILTGRHARTDDRLRFQKEAEAVARLQHPYIVQIYEVGEQNGLPYFSLEFVNGGSLAQFLNGHPQSPETSARFLLEVARAMHYAHKRGIVHRDLKPANILLHMDESQLLRNGSAADTAVLLELSSYVPKISDFGLAKHVGGEEHLLKNGAFIGTPNYMAPEQARGGGHEIGPAADVYALGAILYEMVTGRPPFHATTVAETTRQVLSQDPVPPTQLQPKTPKDLETICLTCLQKDPESRYASAEALAEDLRRFLANEPILARSTAVHERVVKWARRRPVYAALLGGAVVLAVLAFHGWGQMTVELRNERDQARSELADTSAHLHRMTAAVDQFLLDPDLNAGAADEQPAQAEQRRRALYQKAAAVYRKVIRDAGDEPALRPLVAHAHRRLGELSQQLGDAPAARASYRDAARLYAQLGTQFPGRGDFAAQARECQKKADARTP